MGLCSFSTHSFQCWWTQPWTYVARATEKAQYPQQPPLLGRKASLVPSDATVPHIYVHTGWTWVISILTLIKSQRQWSLCDENWPVLNKTCQHQLDCLICHFSFSLEISGSWPKQIPQYRSNFALLYVFYSQINTSTREFYETSVLKKKKASDVWTEN